MSFGNRQPPGMMGSNPVTNALFGIAPLKTPGAQVSPIPTVSPGPQVSPMPEVAGNPQVSPMPQVAGNPQVSPTPQSPFSQVMRRPARLWGNFR